MPLQKVDWDSARQDYITGKMGYREISRKYDVSMATLRRRAGPEKWVEQRKQYRKSVSGYALQAAARREGERLAAVMAANDAFADWCAQIAADPALREQFLRQGRDLRDFSQALLNADQVKRRTYNILTESERVQAELAQKRLDLEREKMEAAKTKDSTIVVKLADGLEEWSE